MESVGFIGLGQMGSRMVRHLFKLPVQVHVYDSNPEALADPRSRGATVWNSPAEVADAAELVLVCLPTPDVVRKVALGPDGIIHGRSVRIYVDHSTTGPSVAREVAAALAEKQIAALDGPLAGGSAGAEAGTLNVMVAGEEWAHQKAKPVLESFGRNVVRVGSEPGQGQILKLVNNMISATTLIASTEAILFGVKAGLDAKVVLDMVNVSSSRSWASEQILTKNVLSRGFDFGFRLALMRKDLRLCISEAEAAGVPMLTCNMARQIFDVVYNQGQGDEDMTEAVRTLEGWSGASIG